MRVSGSSTSAVASSRTFPSSQASQPSTSASMSLPPAATDVVGIRRGHAARHWPVRRRPLHTGARALRRPEPGCGELNRVTAPGGRVLASTHGVQVYHPSPHDYWRWTHEGLHRLFSLNAQWESLEVSPAGGTASCLGMLLGTFVEIGLQACARARIGARAGLDVEPGRAGFGSEGVAATRAGTGCAVRKPARKGDFGW